MVAATAAATAASLNFIERNLRVVLFEDNAGEGKTRERCSPVSKVTTPAGCIEDGRAVNTNAFRHRLRNG